MRLLDFLFPPRVDEAAVRGVSVDEFLSLLAPKLVPETRPGAVALFSFGDSRVRAVIHEAKYHGNSHSFALLAAALVDYLRDADDIREPVIIPVPLGRKRRKERGFNQVEEVANRAAKELGLAVDATVLERTRETTSQISLPRHEREKNMRGAFRAARRVDPSRTCLVIDDVITTGATLQAAIDALQKAGAEHIIPLALAH